MNDPRQRRFFKPKAIRDLFTLGNEGEEGTETGDIFAGTNAKEKTAADAAKDDATNSGKGSEDKDAKSTEGGNASVLNSLLDDSEDRQLHSTMNHDAVLGAGTEEKDLSLLEFEAEKVASEAMEEVRKSARRRQRAGVAVPTWTGKSGLAGLVGSSTSYQGGGSLASSLLQKMKEREGVGRNAGYTANGSGMSKQGSLLNDIINFLQRNGGQSSSAHVVEHFQSDVDKSAEGLQGFKSMLKKVACLEKGSGPNGLSMWKLKRNINDLY